MKIALEEREEARFDMAPMIDMVFLLLVFFMVATQLTRMKEAEEVDIPEARSGAVPETRGNRWVVNVTRDGTILSGSTPIDVEQLKAEVAARSEAEEDLKVYLRADRLCPHREVKKVMGAMAEAGVGDFIFGVLSSDEEGGGGT